jgi:hypothetical protein
MFRRLFHFLIALSAMSGDYNSRGSGKRGFVAMKRIRVSVDRIVGLVAVASALTSSMAAQDTQYGPKEQQIPPPTCLTLRGAWEGGYTPCTAVTHGQWLADVSHW